MLIYRSETPRCIRERLAKCEKFQRPKEQKRELKEREKRVRCQWSKNEWRKSILILFLFFFPPYYSLSFLLRALILSLLLPFHSFPCSDIILFFPQRIPFFLIICLSSVSSFGYDSSLRFSFMRDFPPKWIRHHKGWGRRLLFRKDGLDIGK